MNPILSEAIGSIVRWALAIGAGYIVTAGIWSPEDATKYVAAGALAIIALGWSLWQKYSSRVTLLTALGAGTPLTENQAIEKAKVVAPPVSTPPDVVPRPAP